MRLILLSLLCLTACTNDFDTRSIVRLTTSTRYCPGFLYETNRVMTAAHCYVGAMGQTWWVQLNDARFKNKRFKATYYHADFDRDIIQFTIPVHGRKAPQCEGHIGQSAQTWTWRGFRPEFVQGVVLLHWNKFYHTNADTEKGYSGGPLTVDNCVIGIHTGINIFGSGMARELP